MLNEKELLRYSRSLPVIGKEGQEKLKESKILVIGMGGLGSPAALYLASSGVGTIGIADFDIVDETNLQRQIIHQTKNIGKPKTLSAKEALENLNPFVKILPFPQKLTEKNAEKIIKGFDIVIDGVDSLETKRLINEACVSLGKPVVYGATVGTEGQLAVFTKETGCLFCLIKTPSAPSCSSEGVLPTVPGVIGVLQAQEAIKITLGKKPMQGLLIFDSKMGFKTFSFRKNPSCPVCSPLNVRKKTEAMGFSFFKKKEQPQEQEPQPTKTVVFEDPEITPKELKLLLEKKQVQLIDVREQWEWDICHIEGALLLPLRQLTEKVAQFDKSKFYVTQCHTGQRSLEAQQFLAFSGFKAKSLRGGIEAWAQEIDPGMKRY